MVGWGKENESHIPHEFPIGNLTYPNYPQPTPQEFLTFQYVAVLATSRIAWFCLMVQLLYKPVEYDSNPSASTPTMTGLTLSIFARLSQPDSSTSPLILNYPVGFWHGWVVAM